MFSFLLQCFSQYLQNSKNDGTIKGTADHSLVEVNGHREDEIASQGGYSLLEYFCKANIEASTLTGLMIND